MRRSYITPEYRRKLISGTFNMLEESTFFGAKMLEIEDIINIDDQDIIYYQSFSGEQIDESIESSIDSHIYNISDDKLKNHKIEKDITQSISQLDDNTRWIITINIRKVLVNYLFALLKKHRTFEGLISDRIIYNDVDTAIYNYINLNIVNRYKFKSIDLFINYKDMRIQSLLRYNNIWSFGINNISYKFIKFQTETEYDDSKVKLTFSQSESSKTHIFEYYFNISFEKI